MLDNIYCGKCNSSILCFDIKNFKQGTKLKLLITTHSGTHSIYTYCCEKCRSEFIHVEYNKGV